MENNESPTITHKPVIARFTRPPTVAGGLPQHGRSVSCSCGWNGPSHWGLDKQEAEAIHARHIQAAQ